MNRGQQIGLWIGGATLVVTAAGFLLAASGDSDDGRGTVNQQSADVTSGGDSTVNQGNGDVTDASGASCVGIGTGVTVTCPAPLEVDPNLTDQANAERLFRDVDPTDLEAKPWPFSVLLDDQEGVFIRSAPVKDGAYRLGYATHGSVLWVDCQVTSTFDPEPGRGYGPTWYQVRWPNSEQSEEAFRSAPEHTVRGWAWGFYPQPNGHNGDVPECEEAPI